MVFSNKGVSIEGETYLIKGKKPIAEGATATIYKCKRKGKQHKELYALKKLVAGDLEQQNKIKEEVKTLITLGIVNHPNIIQLVAHETVDNSTFLVYHLYSNGTLENLAEAADTLIMKTFTMLLSGILFLHQSGFRHNDVKPMNVLISDDKITPVITDFGSVSAERIEVTSRKEALTLIDFHARNTTATYRAPELWDIPSECTLTSLADAFSAGAVLFFMLFRKQAFEYNVGKVLLPPGEEGKYEGGGILIDVMLSLLIVDVENRMSVVEALEALNSGSLSEKQRAINLEFYKANKIKR